MPTGSSLARKAVKAAVLPGGIVSLCLSHLSEPPRLGMIGDAVGCV
jgi:hypothetical protein